MSFLQVEEYLPQTHSVRVTFYWSTEVAGEHQVMMTKMITVLKSNQEEKRYGGYQRT